MFLLLYINAETEDPSNQLHIFQILQFIHSFKLFVNFSFEHFVHWLTWLCHTFILPTTIISRYTAHLVLVTASVVYELCIELAPEREEECIRLPPSDCKKGHKQHFLSV